MIFYDQIISVYPSNQEWMGSLEMKDSILHFIYELNEDNNSLNNFAFYSNMMSDFQDLENFKVIPENADVESENGERELQNAVNMIISENESIRDIRDNNNYNMGKNELKTRTDFIKSKYSNDLYNLIQHDHDSENIQPTIPTQSLPPVTRDNMKTRSTKYKADLAEK